MGQVWLGRRHPAAAEVCNRAGSEGPPRFHNSFSLFVESEILNCESALGAFDKDKVLVGAFP